MRTPSVSTASAIDAEPDAEAHSSATLRARLGVGAGIVVNQRDVAVIADGVEGVPAETRETPSGPC